MRDAVKKRKRFVILSVALFMICGMALGYAALSSSIKINGTGTISTNWDILFTNIVEKSSKGAVNNDSRITDKLTATFDVDLDSPGSYIEYNVTIKNNANIDAVIAKVAGIVEANNAAPTGIQFKVSGIRIGDDLLAGDEKTFVVRAEIPRGETTLPSGTKTLDLKVNVRQKDIDSSGLVTTIGECFETNEAGDTITRYLCGKNNTNGYSEILDVNIPREINGHTITTIGPSAFSQKRLTSVMIPNTIVTISSKGFYQNQLTNIVLPDSVTTIGTYAFSGNRLGQLHLPKSVKTIEYDAFVNNQLTEIDIPSSVTSIGLGAFRGNQMPDEEAFIYNRNSDGTEDKSSLNSYAGAERSNVVIPNNVKIIGTKAFCDTSITEIELPNQLTTIANYAFLGTSLSSISFPQTLESISFQAFMGVPLTRIEFQGNVPALGTSILGIFTYKGANTIKVPIGTLEQYKNVNHPSYSPSQLWFGQDDESLLDAFYE